VIEEYPMQLPVSGTLLFRVVGMPNMGPPLTVQKQKVIVSEGRTVALRCES
jgi:hypothetical protein